MPLAGFSLVELVVALAISLFLISAAVTVYVRGRVVFETNETVARLQDAGRYALSVIEPDIELAGYFGLSNTAASFRLVEHGRTQSFLATAWGLRQSAGTAISELGTAAHACGRNFAIDILRVAQGSNGRFALGPDATSACQPYPPGAESGADTLTLRRASVDVTTAQAGRIQILSSRLSGFGGQLLFVDGQPPARPDVDHEIHDLLVRAYYVARSSVDHAHFPALRVKSLTSISGRAAFADSEVVPGIEDLQVQFAIDSASHNGQASSYVNPDFPDLESQQIVAVRLWVRVRAESPEPGFADDRQYDYADVRFVPAGAERAIRRVLLSRTIALRNARIS